MHGRMGGIALAFITLLASCNESPEQPPPKALASQSELAQDYTSSETGSIHGRVVWEGQVPVAVSTLVRAIAYHPRIHEHPVRYETPHIPRVQPENQGIADAVVYLRNFDARHSRPWDHARVRVDFHSRQMQLRQGGTASNTGFILKGGKVETVNHDADYHALRGRGAVFFTLPLLTQEHVSSQTVTQTGLVELFDAGGYYWSHAHLFVVEHPYYARTDSAGNFTLEEVPEGNYKIVSWMPSWHVARSEIDPETAVIARLVWHTPQEQRQQVHVQKGKGASVSFCWTQAMFERH